MGVLGQKWPLLLQERAGTPPLAGWLVLKEPAQLCAFGFSWNKGWFLLPSPASGQWEPVLGSDPSQELVGAGQQRSTGPWEPLSHPAGGVQTLQLP